MSKKFSWKSFFFRIYKIHTRLHYNSHDVIPMEILYSYNVSNFCFFIKLSNALFVLSFTDHGPKSKLMLKSRSIKPLLLKLLLVITVVVVIKAKNSVTLLKIVLMLQLLLQPLLLQYGTKPQKIQPLLPLPMLLMKNGKLN